MLALKGYRLTDVYRLSATSLLTARPRHYINSEVVGLEALDVVVGLQGAHGLNARCIIGHAVDTDIFAFHIIVEESNVHISGRFNLVAAFIKQGHIERLRVFQGLALGFDGVGNRIGDGFVVHSGNDQLHAFGQSAFGGGYLHGGSVGFTVEFHGRFRRVGYRRCVLGNGGSSGHRCGRSSRILVGDRLSFGGDLQIVVNVGGGNRIGAVGIMGKRGVGDVRVGVGLGNLHLCDFVTSVGCEREIEVFMQGGLQRVCCDNLTAHGCIGVRHVERDQSLVVFHRHGGLGSRSRCRGGVSSRLLGLGRSFCYCVVPRSCIRAGISGGRSVPCGRRSSRLCAGLIAGCFTTRRCLRVCSR